MLRSVRAATALWELVSKLILTIFFLYALLSFKSVLAMKSEDDFAKSIFAQRCPRGSSVGEIANTACAIWREINTVLSPIIGHHGVVALIKRSVHLQQTNYPVLKALHDFRILPGEFPALHAILIKETADIALLINSAILNKFNELLTSLIGTSLTHHLLLSVFTKHSSGDSAQDTLL